MVRREELTPELVDSAIGLYVELAYGTAPRKRDAGAAADALADFVDETHGRREPGSASRPCAPERYSLRLGNRNYPFMKLVVQEHLVPGDFYFSVDAHDDLRIRADFPDYEAWQKVRCFNLELKQRIEEAFAAAGLPTLATVCERAERLGGPAVSPASGPLILVVDDEADEARALSVLLEREGYAALVCPNGRAALDALASCEPALIVLDYEMPEMDGLALLRALRENDATRQIPCLLTTGSQHVRAEDADAEGFLPKPFHSTEFVGLVAELLEGA